MSNENVKERQLVVASEEGKVANLPRGWTEEQKRLLRDTIAKGATENELALLLYVVQRTGLDPFLRQIHAVKRWDSELGREVMTIQAGIDGYRLIAERTGKYAPGPEPTFEYDKDGNLVKATAYVMKLVAGTWHKVAASAYYAEYVQRRKDGSPTRFWKTMPHCQLAKCAEALALRKAFPAELSGLYTHEEMEQADNEAHASPSTKPAHIGFETASVTNATHPPGGKSLQEQEAEEEDPLAPYETEQSKAAAETAAKAAAEEAALRKAEDELADAVTAARNELGRKIPFKPAPPDKPRRTELSYHRYRETPFELASIGIVVSDAISPATEVNIGRAEVVGTPLSELSQARLMGYWSWAHDRLCNSKEQLTDEEIGKFVSLLLGCDVELVRRFKMKPRVK